MAVGLNTAQATVGTTATLIIAGRPGRKEVTLVNHGTTDVYFGAAGVSTSTGSLLTGTKGAGITIATEAAIYGIVGSGTQAVSAIETF